MEKSNRRQRRTYTAEFKLKIVNLYENKAKSKIELTKEYEINPSSLSKWIEHNRNSGSFKHKDNLSEIELKNIQLKKEKQDLLMENDILKQAALIMAQKRK